MATSSVIAAGHLAILLMGAAVLGTVERRERFLFGAGVALLLVGMTVRTGSTGAIVAAVGVVAVIAATVPLLRD